MKIKEFKRNYLGWIAVSIFTLFTSMETSGQCSQWQTTPSAQCVNSPSITLLGSPSPGVFFGQGVTGSTFSPSAAGVGTWQIGYSANSCSDTAYVNIVVNGLTNASLSGLDTAYCINNNPQLIPLTAVPVNGTLSGPGVTGGNFNISLAGAGNHTVIYAYTNANGCTDTASLDVRVRALPNTSLTIPNSQKFVCELDAPYTISGNSPNPGWPAGWLKGDGVDSLLGIFNPALGSVGWNVITYHYYDGLCSNTAVDSILINENPTASLNNLPSPCVTDPVITLTQGVGSPLGGSGVYSGIGVTGTSGNYFFDPATAGAGTHPITFCYTAANGCETCVTQNIIVRGIPAVTFNPLSGLCENGGPVDLTSPWRGQPQGGFYQGPGIQIDSTTLKPSQMGGPGSYTLSYTYTDTFGCTDTKQQTVTVNPKPFITVTAVSPAPTPNPPLDSSNVTIKICEGDTAFTTSSAIPSASFTYLPALYVQFVPGGANFFPPDDFMYEVIGLGSNGCSDTGSISVDVIPPAIAEISGPPAICIGDTAVLTASGANTYIWLNPVANTPSVSVTPKANAEYQVIADSDNDGDGNKCSSDTAVWPLVVNPLPLISTGADTILFFGDATSLKAYGGVSYSWGEGVQGELSCYDCNSPRATPIYQAGGSNKRVYYVTGTDTNGCINYDSIFITLNPRIVIFVPTAFSPNGDGVNDVVKVETKGIANIEFEIYDRYGKIVYESTDLTKSWDGKTDGELINKDVYLYKLKAYPYEKTVPPIDQAGQITLIR